MQVTPHPEDLEQPRQYNRHEQNPAHVKERQGLIIEQIGGGWDILAAIEPGTGNFGADIDEG
jgi:hypothetical protein